MEKPQRMFGTWAPGGSVLISEKIADEACVPSPHDKFSGGTSHFLPLERKRATFETLKLTHFLDGGPKATAHRRWLWEAGEAYDNSHNYFMTREEVISAHVERFLGIHKKFAEEGYQPAPNDIMMMTNASRNQGAFGLHFGAFVNTIASQATPEQMFEWGLPAFQMKITGCLGQTELGHGSNVKGLQTTAIYDKKTKEFVLNTPTLQATKWWPGGMGKTATHCMLYANLIIDGKEYGFHCFIVQLRDENHKPLPGVEPGEVGPKIGDNGTETGYLRLHDVRIPREWMMMKNQVVHEDGTYERITKNAKSQYGTMLTIRAGLVMGAGYRLAQGVTIAIRYSCVRHQGFINTQVENNRTEAENAILEYQNQQYRLFKQLTQAYAFIFTGKSIAEKFIKLQTEQDEQGLPEMHATSAALKALCTFEGAAGLEDCRKCCGGHGVLLASGVAQMALDYTTYCTAEGDKIILELQSARFLLKSLEEAQKGEKVGGLASYLMEVRNQGFDVTNILRCKATTSVEFQDLSVLADLFKNRALSCIIETQERLKGMLDSGIDYDSAWNSCAVDLAQCSRVHCYHVILQNFISSVMSAEDASIARILKILCQAYALFNLSEDLGNFELSRSQKRALRQALRESFPFIRNDCVALVDAFEFPDNVLNSAIGRYDGKVYEALFTSAKASPLNATDPFPGYHEHLRPNLDLDFIKEHAKMQRAGPASMSRL